MKSVLRVIQIVLLLPLALVGLIWLAQFVDILIAPDQNGFDLRELTITILIGLMWFSPVLIIALVIGSLAKAIQKTNQTGEQPDGGKVAGNSMSRRILYIFAWAVVFRFGAALIIGFASGVFFFASSSLSGTDSTIQPTSSIEASKAIQWTRAAQNPSDETTSWIGMTWIYGPEMIGLLGLILGISGFLPNTGGKRSK